MGLTVSGAKNIVKKLRSNFGLSHLHARAALDSHWMLLASAKDVDRRKAEFILDSFPGGNENCVRVIADDRLIATMRFPLGTLPKSELQEAWEEYDAYIAGCQPSRSHPFKILGDELCRDLNWSFGAR